MAKLTKKQEDFMDISIQLADFPEWYNTRDQITGKRYAILERKTDIYICGYGSKEEILSFLRGYRFAMDKAAKI